MAEMGEGWWFTNKDGDNISNKRWECYIKNGIVTTTCTSLVTNSFKVSYRSFSERIKSLLDTDVYNTLKRHWIRIGNISIKTPIPFSLRWDAQGR